MRLTSGAVGRDRQWDALVLVVAVATVLAVAWLVRSHWFYADDWTFLTRAGPDDLHLLVRPANGHWMGATALVFALVRRIAGLATYLAYALPAILAHGGTGFLLWRWQRRDGVTPWVAVGLTAAFLVYGAAGENLFFAVNVGFNLSLLLGLGFALLVEAPPATRSRARLVAAAILALAAVPTSTTGPVLVVGVGLWSAWRRDLPGVLAAVPAMATYGVWLLFADGGTGLPGGAITDVVAFVGALVVTAAGRLLGADGVVAAIVLVATGGAVLAVAGGGENSTAVRPRPLTLVVALVGLAVGGATALARVQYGLETWRSPRYAYVVAALLLPLVAVAIDRVVRSGRPGQVLLAVALPVAVTLNAIDLHAAHRAEVGLEQHLRQRWTAAAQLLEAGVEPVAVNVDRYWAPNLHTGHLRDLAASGAFPVPDERVGDPWRLEAHVELRSVLHGPMPYDVLTSADLGADEDGDGCVVLAPGEEVAVGVSGPSGITITSDGPTLARIRTTTEDGRTVALERVLALRAPFPRVAWIDGPTPATANLRIDGGGRVCALTEEDTGRFADTEPS